MLRALMLVLPTLAAFAVGWAVLIAGAPRPVEAARLFGGPNRPGQTDASWLLQRVATLRGDPHPAAPGLTRVIVSQAGRELGRWQGETGPEGFAEVALALQAPLTRSVLQLRVEASEGAVLGRASLAVGQAPWGRRGTRQLPGKREGELKINASLPAGTLAVPFSEQLTIEVEEATSARPVAGAELSLQLDGATLVGADRPPLALVTDGDGRATTEIVPEHHAIVLRIEARRESRHGSFYGPVPVTPGAMALRRNGSALDVLSPIPREIAFVSFISERRRLAGAVVHLETTREGLARGSIEPPSGLPEATWVVLSSEPDKSSSGAIAWPLPNAAPAAPPPLFARDSLVLDGLGEARTRERRRQRRARGWGAGIALGCTLALLGLMLHQTRTRHGSEHLGESPARAWPLLLCLTLGLFALAAFATLASF